MGGPTHGTLVILWVTLGNLRRVHVLSKYIKPYPHGNMDYKGLVKFY
jgi:hypothetical protein